MLASILSLVATPAAAKPPLWDKVISGKGRFQALSGFAGEAILDKETGLVWERAPTGQHFSWPTSECLGRNVGGRRGWRLPRYEELASLIVDETDALPIGHPFQAPNGTYWTASSRPSFDGGPADQVFVVQFPADGSVAFAAKTDAIAHRVWCVRGPGGVEGQ
jgi:hypothetical protein